MTCIPSPTSCCVPSRPACSLHHVSLFSGVGGFELAMAEAGIPTIAAAEIDKKARGVLHDRFPGVHIYHDVKEVTGDSLRALGAIPGRTVVSAGWPCQGNSVAGDRRGMDDPRSGLWSEVVRVLAELRPAWFVGENVPGLLSIAGGRDFATVLGDLARLGYGFAYRVLDAQHFGVPQRRRRVVIVGRLGDSGRAPAQVLLEPEGGGRNPAEGIAPRQIFARRAAAGAFHSGISRALTASNGMRFDANGQEFIVSITGTRSHTLTAEGCDASGDGTGRGTPIVVTSRVGRCPDCGHEAGRHNWFSRCMGTLQQPDCICERTPDSLAVAYVADTVNALDTAQGGPDDNSAQAGHLVAFQCHGSNVGPMGTIRKGDGGVTSGVPFVATDTIVRRLTPLETCRLQGYPDDHTTTSNGHPQADGPRYKQHGNGIAVPVFAWVAKRIVAVDREASA